MISRKLSTQEPSVAGLQAAPPPRGATNMGWLVILTLAAIGSSLTLSCITPFAALAVAFAGTVRLRAALANMSAIWLSNQVVGFVFLGFPRTPNTFLCGLAIGVAALFSTVIAFKVSEGAFTWAAPTRLCVALLASFVVYEVALLMAAFFLGGLEAFTPTIVAQLAFNNLLWLVGLIVLNEGAVLLCRSSLRRLPRLARAS